MIDPALPFQRDPVQMCTGAYVGGRVIITAGHCFDRFGYQMDSTFSPPCTTDADCPTKVIMGQPTQLQCATVFGEPATPGECYYPEPAISNYYLHAYFGESYEPFGQRHPTRSVPISYCHIYPDLLDAPAQVAFDFAYCILAEEPDVQPVPIMMHCEVDAYMNGEYDLDVRFVGFGMAGLNSDWPADKPGRKRWATSTTDGFPFSSNDILLSFSHFSDFEPGVPLEGDSGSPALVKLPPPHDTWHVFGVMSKPTFAVAPWQFVEWMHEDPEVVASNILPCHDVDGSWAPTAQCQGFPLNPGSGVGDWSFGPKACYTEDVSGWSTTCGEPYEGSPLPGPVDDISPPTPPRDHDSETDPASRVPAQAIGCTAGSTPNIFGLALLGLTLLVRRRRRTTPARLTTLVICLPVVAAGCSEEATGGDETGDTGGEAPTEPVEMHPSLHKTHSGLELEGTGYQRLAVGNITRPIGDPTCCQDIVLGGPLSPDAELFFGGGSTERGLTFLADRPTQAYAMAATGDGIQDLALADLNSDGRNDLLAVSTNGQLGVRLGVSSDSPLDALNLFGIANGPLGRIALGDLDCDGDLDVVATAPDDAGIVVALQTSSGAFGAGSFISTVPVNDEDAAGNPQDVAVGDLDGAGALDLVTMNDNGTVTTFLRATCDGPVTVTSKRVYSNVGNCSMHNETGCISDTNGSHVITQDVFCETALSDVTVAFADRVLVFCNTGDINAIISTSGYADYRWDVNGPGHAHLARISDINWWSTPKSLHALVERQLLRLTDPGTDYNGSDRPKLEVLKAEGIPVQFDMVRHTNDGIADWWQRIIWVSSIGELGFVR